jgi:hypothetical protein
MVMPDNSADAAPGWRPHVIGVALSVAMVGPLLASWHLVPVIDTLVAGVGWTLLSGVIFIASMGPSRWRNWIPGTAAMVGGAAVVALALLWILPGAFRIEDIVDLRPAASVYLGSVGIVSMWLAAVDPRRRTRRPPS